MEVKIIKMGINGEGIGYLNKKPVFVKGAFEGEKVLLKNVVTEKTYLKAEVEKVLSSCHYRIKSPCKYDKKCDGCVYMQAPYEKQLQWKKELIDQTLIKYAHLNKKLISDVVPNDLPFGYRNQCKMPIVKRKDKLVSGLYLEGSNQLVEVSRCLVHDKKVDQVRGEVLAILNHYEFPDFSEKGIRYLVIRNLDNQIQVTLVTGKIEIDSKIIEAIMKISGVVSLYQNIHANKKVRDLFTKNNIFLAGEKKINFSFNDLKLSCSNTSFFQLNTNQAARMMNYVASLVEPCNTLFEAYCGIGVISLTCAAKAKKITGVEIVKDAITNAKENANLNGIKNCEFICGDAGEICASLAKKNEVDCMIVDPPRSGLDEAMLTTILKSNAKQLIYVSCNPSTLAKNLAELQKKYVIKSIVPFDMFSNTPLVESVVNLKLK